MDAHGGTRDTEIRIGEHELVAEIMDCLKAGWHARDGIVVRRAFLSVSLCL